MAKNNILIVGAGAVGQVYGWLLAQGGNKVTFLVKDKYRKVLEQGLTLYDINRDKHKRHPIHFTGYGIVTDWDSAAQGTWDQIYLCIPSDAMLTFDYDGLKRAMGGGATVVFLQPGPDDYALVAPRIPQDRMVQGMIVFVSYTAPFPKETVPEPGIAFWQPPLTPTPFMGPRERRDAVIQTFRTAGISATANESLRDIAPYPTVVLTTFVAALQACDWQFTRLRRNKVMQETLFAAQHEAMQAVASHFGTQPPLWRHMLNRATLAVLLKMMPRVLPVDMEAHVKMHYTKLQDQTRLYLKAYGDYAQAAGLEHGAIQRLQAIVA